MAPLLKAARAISIEPYAVINTMGKCGSWRCTSLSNSIPLRSGRLTSRSMRSNGRSSSRDNPDSAVSALETRYPSVLSKSSRPSRISDSSSMTRIDPLDTDAFPDCWEFDMERSSSTGGRSYVDLAGMFLDDPVAHAETETGSPASGLRREERIKNPMDVLAGNSVTGIHYFNFHAAVVRGGTHFQHSAERHRIARVQKEIQKYLLELVGRTPYRGQSRAQLLHHLNLRCLQRVGDKRQGFFDDM